MGVSGIGFRRTLAARCGRCTLSPTRVGAVLLAPGGRVRQAGHGAIDRRAGDSHRPLHDDNRAVHRAVGARRPAAAAPFLAACSPSATEASLADRRWRPLQRRARRGAGAGSSCPWSRTRPRPSRPSTSRATSTPRGACLSACLRACIHRLIDRQGWAGGLTNPLPSHAQGRAPRAGVRGHGAAAGAHAPRHQTVRAAAAGMRRRANVVAVVLILRTSITHSLTHTGTAAPAGAWGPTRTGAAEEVGEPSVDRV